MKMLKILLRYSKTSVIVAVLMGAFAGLASSGLIALINSAVNHVSSDSPNPYLWGFVGLVLFLPVARNLSAYFLNLVGQRAAFDLRLKLTRKILSAPLLQLEKLGNHRLLAALTSDVNSMSGAFQQIPLIAINGAVVLGCLAYMAWLSWKAALLVAGLMTVGLLTYRFVVSSGLRRQSEAREVADEIYSSYKAVTEGAKELKLHHDRRNSFLGTLEEQAERFLKLNIVAATIYRVGGSWEQLLLFVAIGFLLFAAPALMDVPMSVQTGFVLTILYMMSPLQLLLNAVPALSRASVAVEKVERLGLSLLPDKAKGAQVGEDATTPQMAFGKQLESIRMRGVVYSYQSNGLPGGPGLKRPLGPGLKRPLGAGGKLPIKPGGQAGKEGLKPLGKRPLGGEEGPGMRLRTFGRPPGGMAAPGEDNFSVGPVDLELRPGELFFLTGGNGSGKTTLAKLITGLYEPLAGEITVNGTVVDNGNRESYRQLFAAVFADFFLFEKLLGLEEVSDLDEQARRYLDQLRLSEKVNVENGSLSTLDLSQGQRKRLALLTAYLEDRPVYIFDEWAADQDPVFKHFFYETLLPQLKAQGKAVVVISHDDRYYHIADEILKLEDGRTAS